MAAHEHGHDHHHDHGHDHAHGHDHVHDHGHDRTTPVVPSHAPGHHHHGEDDSYYLDQLCMIGLSGAFGVVCLTLYFWQTNMLGLVLAPQFHLFILGSGVVLVGLALTRAALLWLEAGKTAPAHAHGNGHDHVHAHDHVHGHVHDHDHDHDHAHGHHHTHDHGHEDHDHGWAPWRYVVLLVPLMLFLLGLPNKAPKPPDVSVSLAPEDMRADIGLVGAGVDLFTLFTYLPLWGGDQSTEDAVPKTFKEVKQALETPYIQDDWLEKKLIVSVTGMYTPSSMTTQAFGLARFSMQCCGADAVPVVIPVISREGITHIKKGEWVRVMAQLELVRGRDGARVARLKAAGRGAVTPTAPDAIPWIR